ncbi:transposon ty3-g gag-pol polyprotein, partial [Cystoisospora suis]
WTQDCERAFQKLKEEVLSAPLLHHPIPDLPYIIDCDASVQGWGAVLQQHLPGEASPRIIGYASKVFTAAEKKWSTTELEALAVIYRLEEFRGYILGQQCTVRTDHGPLRWLQAAKKGRLARWALRLQEFDFVLEHRRGSQQAHVDALSRSPGAPREKGELWSRSPALDKIFPDYAFASVAQSRTEGKQRSWPLRDRTSSDIVTEQQRDNETRALVKAIRTGDDLAAPRWWHLLPRFLRGQYLVHEGILYKQGANNTIRIFVPRALRNHLILAYHVGPFGAHFGTGKVHGQLSRRYAWPATREDIQRVLEGCLSCARRKSRNPHHRLAPKRSTPLPKPGLFHTWALDAYGLLSPTSRENMYILVMIDHFSKWAEIIPIGGITAEIVVTAIVHRLICQYGCPAALLTDNAKVFDSHLIQELAFRWGIHKLRVTPYNPQANGIVENFMKTLGNSLACLLME